MDPTILLLVLRRHLAEIAAAAGEDGAAGAAAAKGRRGKDRMEDGDGDGDGEGATALEVLQQSFRQRPGAVLDSLTALLRLSPPVDEGVCTNDRKAVLAAVCAALTVEEIRNELPCCVDSLQDALLKLGASDEGAECWREIAAAIRCLCEARIVVIAYDEVDLEVWNFLPDLLRWVNSASDSARALAWTLLGSEEVKT